MKKMFCVCLAALVLYSCQTVYVPQAREVKKKPLNGGVIAIPTNYRPEDRQKADQLMSENCGTYNVKVADEGEVVTGQSTKSSATTANRDDSRRSEGSFLGIPMISGSAGGADTEQSAITTQLKEWQVSYDCEQTKSNSKKR